MDSEAEGTPLSGRLPLELQQIRDQSMTAAALAARRRSEDVKSSERNILKIRRRSFGESSLSPEDAAKRRSSRAIKRRKFDDEMSDLNSLVVVNTGSTPGPAGPSTPPPPSSAESRSRNSSLCLTEPSTPVSGPETPTINLISSSDLRLKKFIRDKRKRKGRREENVKELGRWKPTDDLALISAVEQTKDLNKVFAGVKFSCHFSLIEVQERWYTLLYDPVISQLAQQATRNLPHEIVQKILSETPFSRQEEDAIINCGVKSSAPTVSLAEFDKLLQSKPGVFHHCRTGRALLTHWQYLKFHSLLPEQNVRPIPRPESGQQILDFMDGEELVVDAELQDPEDAQLNSELVNGERNAKHEIRRMEAEVSKWQGLVDIASGTNTSEFDNQTLAVLRGRLVRYLMRSREISVGRAAKDHIVDVDLTLEGPASKISRRQAIIMLKSTAEFHLANEGNGSVVVNGVPVLPGESTILHNNAVVEFASLRFIFLVNLELNEAIRSEAVKNNFVKSLL